MEPVAVRCFFGRGGPQGVCTLYRLAVFQAGEAQSALQQIRNAKFDVIVLDIKMPGMDGIEAARKIRQTRPHDEQPAILALTANATQQDAAECLEAGMDGFLSKPVAPAALAKALERCARARFGEADDGSQRMSV